MMSSLTLSLILSLALPTAVIRGTAASPVRGGVEELASMIKSIMERRAAQPIELLLAGEGHRRAAERAPASALPPSPPPSPPSSGAPPEPRPAPQSAPLPAVGSAAPAAPPPPPWQRSHREVLRLFLLGLVGLTALGGGLVLARRRRHRCERCGGEPSFLDEGEPLSKQPQKQPPLVRQAEPEARASRG